jgi:UDP-glucose 4-epimerase
MKNNKILVTGGAGFIGSNLVKYLLDHDYEVTVVDNFLTGHMSNLDTSYKNLSFVEADIRDFEIVNQLTKGVDTIFHLAASVGNKRSIDFPIDDAQINVIGTINILEAAKKNDIRKIVTSSSAGIFGELKTIPISEDHPIDPDTPYGATKLCQEKLCLSYAKLYQFEAVCLRYFNVYGQNQRFDAYGNVIPIFVHNIIHNIPIKIYGDGLQTRDFVHVNDVVMANFNSSLAEGVSGAFNIASGQSISINELVSILSSFVNREVKVVYMDKRPGDVMHSLANISSAKSKFNFNPTTDLFEGLRTYFEWAEYFYSKE